MLAIGLALVVATFGVVAFVLLRDDDEPSRITLPTPTSVGTIPGEDATLGAGAPDPSGVLKTTLSTARGSTFTRVGTRTDSCVARANSTLLERLRLYPCAEQLYSGVYANSSRTIVTVISIMRLGSSTAATSVSSATYSEGWPRLLHPAANSGLPRLSQDPSFWTRTWRLNDRIIYAQSYWARGGAVGDQTGSIYTTAGELGVEVTNALRFTN